ncbi:hypothetical protein [Chitinophaga pinensis]|uniref:Uncharacterized protein n=1 Tax=Chitinophaga pinensis (strain ATCC 43595 / DSM 2588 / LMG 13176 / NBRC 15968 / NCIMB 11800 / UQM 2034) TaxID=485918 RepID=A0A979H061_CHIPD|nr:hypothetical protein [Chitinophaga pinensis]ACU64521.1 hypothetical protein Cpin_7120 [Chitinophaga pinensis DSM 2588]
MKINFLVTGMLLCTTGTYAQNMFSMASQHPADTTKSEAMEQAIRFSSLRQASITADFFGSGHFDSKLNEKDFANGKSRNARISSYVTVPISSWNGNTIGASVYHTETFFNVREVENKLESPTVNVGDMSKSTLGLSINYSRIDALFHTPVVYSAVVTGISDNLKTIRRFNFNGSIAFPLKRNENTYLSVGAILLIDPSAPLPVLPVVNYFHKLNHHGLELIVDLPQGAMIKQSLFRNAWVYVGASYNTYATFYKSDNPALPEHFSYNTVEVKSGPGFEYLLGKHVILGVKGGVNNVLTARAFGKNNSYNDSFIMTTNKSTFAGEFRISLLPF